METKLLTKLPRSRTAALAQASACAPSAPWWSPARRLTPGAIAELLDVAPSALSFHLKEIAHSGLVSSEPRGRNLIYRANFEQMTALLGYLTEHCCQGESCGVNC